MSAPEFRVRTNANHEKLFQPLYDAQPFARQMVFFQTPIGAQDKTRAETNMECAGMLCAPTSFIITGIHLDVTGSDAMRRLVAGHGWLSLQIGAKMFLEMGPLGVFMPTSKNFGKAIVPRRFKLDEAFDLHTALMLPPQQNFIVRVDAGISRRYRQRVFVHLLGYMIRLAQ